MKRLQDTTADWTAVAIGAAIAATPAWMATTVATAGLLLAFGAATMIYGAWPAIARRRGGEQWPLLVVGLLCTVAVAGGIHRRARSLGRVDRRWGPRGDRSRAHSHRGAARRADDIVGRTGPLCRAEYAVLICRGGNHRGPRLLAIS